MLFGKKDHLVGLDIGSRAVKAAEIVETKGGRALKNLAMADIPPASIDEGGIKKPAEVAEVIRQLFKTHGIKEQNVAISVGGYSVIVKKINVQHMPEEDLQESIQFEAEQYIPFDISDVNLDFQILGPSDNSANQMSVLLVAAKKDMLDEYLHLLELASLNACIIDVDAFALQNIYEANYDIDDQNVALIDIGANKTSLNILKGHASVFMRDVSLGGIQILQKIRSQAGCTLEEAEAVLTGNSTGRLSADALREIESSVATAWCAEIRRAIDFFYSTYNDDQINKIILSGGGAKNKGFRELLASETSCDVEVINPFKHVNMDKCQLDASQIEAIAPHAAISLGLAIRRVNDK